MVGSRIKEKESPWKSACLCVLNDYRAGVGQGLRLKVSLEWIMNMVELPQSSQYFPESPANDSHLVAVGLDCWALGIGPPTPEGRLEPEEWGGPAEKDLRGCASQPGTTCTRSSAPDFSAGSIHSPTSRSFVIMSGETETEHLAPQD